MLTKTKSRPTTKLRKATRSTAGSADQSIYATDAIDVAADLSQHLSTNHEKAKRLQASAAPLSHQSISSPKARSPAVDAQLPDYSRSMARSILSTDDPAATSFYQPTRSKKASITTAGEQQADRSSSSQEAKHRPDDPLVFDFHQPIKSSQSNACTADEGTSSRSSFTAQSSPDADGAGAIDLRFIDPVVAEIRDGWRIRQAWHRAEKSLTLQMSALCRRHVGVRGKDDKEKLTQASKLLALVEKGSCDDPMIVMACAPLLAARNSIEPMRTKQERALEKLARKLPVAHVVELTPGFGYGSLAALVGEAGDFTAYRGIRSIWKRLGVALIEGERQRRVTDVELAILHGYNPTRRSVLFNVGNSLINAGKIGRGPRPLVGEDIDLRAGVTHWQKVFMKRMRYEAERNPEHARPPTKDGTQESFSLHAFNRSRRYTEKLFIRFLWQQWKEAKCANA